MHSMTGKRQGINTHESRQLSQIRPASLNIRRPKHHGSLHHEDIKFGLRCSHWTRNLEADGSHICRICSNSGSRSSHANHDTHRVESRKITQCPSNVSSLARTYQKVWITQLRQDFVEHQITLAPQNVRGHLANALSLSINEKSTWNDTHKLLINYLNNSIRSDTKEIYQLDISGKVTTEDSMNQVGRKGKSKKSKGQSKGKGPCQNQNQNKGRGKSQSSKGKTKSKGKGQ